MDNGGMLNVGPRSAGASPGPICYDHGGEEPTLTDSYVILGYMNPDNLLGGDFPLNLEKTRQIYQEKVAGKLNRGLLEAAYGVYEIANSNIRRAITAVSSERGRDPRGFSLFVFGGAGALHGAAAARSMGMKEVIVAPLAGVFSAYGLLCADIQRIYVHAFDALLEPGTAADANQLLQRMAQQAIRIACDQGYPANSIQIQRYVDLRYRKQQSELTLPLPEGDLEEEHFESLKQDFHREYEATFGFRLSNTSVDMVNLRVSSIIPISKPPATSSKRNGSAPRKNGQKLRKAYFGEEHGYLNTPILELGSIGPEQISGPALIDTYDSTIVVPPKSCVRFSQGLLIITLT
jgi:N-methylhydantoinase A